MEIEYDDIELSKRVNVKALNQALWKLDGFYFTTLTRGRDENMLPKVCCCYFGVIYNSQIPLNIESFHGSTLPSIGVVNFYQSWLWDDFER